MDNNGQKRTREIKLEAVFWHLSSVSRTPVFGWKCNHTSDTGKIFACQMTNDTSYFHIYIQIYQKFCILVNIIIMKSIKIFGAKFSSLISLTIYFWRFPSPLSNTWGIVLTDKNTHNESVCSTCLVNKSDLEFNVQSLFSSISTIFNNNNNKKFVIYTSDHKK